MRIQNKPVKLKKCAVCPVEFPRFGLKKVCSPGCAIVYAKLEAEKKQKRENAVKRRNMLANDLGHWKKKAQQAFNAYIRKRDDNLGCISCDKTKDWNGQWHAGHYRTVGAAPWLRFDERNCHKQCSVCNNYLSGNLAEYRKSLILKIGIAAVEDIESSASISRLRLQDYKDIYHEYKNKLKNPVEIS